MAKDVANPTDITNVFSEDEVEFIKILAPTLEGKTDKLKNPSVATRLTGDQLFRQVLQGGGNMPAYGKNLSPPEATALVAFLKTLHPKDERPAVDASLVGSR